MSKDNKYLIFFIILSVISHLIAVYYSVGYHHFDEHYQILEFASFKLERTAFEDLAWEYSARIRPTFQPYIALIVVDFFSMLGVTSTAFHSLFLRLLSALLSLYCVFELVRCFRKDFPRKMVYVFFLFLSLLTWYFPYLHSRFSAEVWAVNFFILALVRVYKWRDDIKFNDAIAVGFLFGLSFVMKFQSGVLSGGVILWLLFVKRESLKNMSAILLAYIVTFLVFGLCVDYLFYGEWVLTPLNYFKVNVLEDKTSEFGTSSWWFYFHMVYHRSFVPLGVVTLIACVYLPFSRPKHLLTWVLVPYVFLHFLIGHKELRFLFPIAFFIPLLVSMGLQDLLNFYPSLRVKKYLLKPVVIIVMGFHLVLLPLGALKPASSSVKVFRYLNENYKESVTVNHQNCFACLELFFYSKQKITYNKVPEDILMRSYILESFTENDVFVTSNKLGSEEQGKSGLELRYQTAPNWCDTEFIRHTLKLGPVWYVYVPERP